MRCKNCGKELLPDTNFCRYCGTKIIHEEVPEAPNNAPLPATPSEVSKPPMDLSPESLSTPEAIALEADKKQSRGIKKNVLLGGAAFSLVAVVVLIIFLTAGKGKPTETNAPTEISLSEQLEQAQTWQEYYEIGQTHQKQQDYESTIAAFEAALALDDTNNTVRLALAETYVTAERFKSALAEYETLAETGATPYYEERTQCYLALNQPEKAGQMLHAAYLETGDETITALEQKYWNTDALHAYGEYVGYDGNYAFGLFDWNHDLTPELMYVYNATDYGNSVGASVELWTYQRGEMQKLYVSSTSLPGVSLTTDGSILAFRPATHGYYLTEQLYWDDSEITVHNFLDCYLEGQDFTEYELHPELNYFWEDEPWARGSFVENVQVSYEQYEQAQEEASNGAERIPYWPVTYQNCKTYLDYDWDEINEKPESYTIKKRHYMDYRSVETQFGTTFLQTSDESSADYGVYALTRSDTGGIIELFTLPFDDHEMYRSFYIDGEDEVPCTKQTDDCVLFELWYGVGMVCNLSFDTTENKLYELNSGSYDIWDDQLIYSSLTFDTDSPKTIEVQTHHGEPICTLVSGYTRTGYATKEDHVYVWGWNASQSTSYPEICDMEIWRYTRGEAAPICLATVPAYCIVDVNDDSVTYKIEWDGADYTIPLSSDSSAAQAPALTSQTGLDKTLYPRPERTLKAGMGGEDVKYVQALLISMNYDVPRITGGFDEITEGSVVAWQKRHGYEQTGIVDETTLRLMEKAEEIWLQKQGR